MRFVGTAVPNYLRKPASDLQQLPGAMAGDQDAMDGFDQVMAGVTCPAEFFSDHNVGRILSLATAAHT